MNPWVGAFLAGRKSERTRIVTGYALRRVAAFGTLCNRVSIAEVSPETVLSGLVLTGKNPLLAGKISRAYLALARAFLWWVSDQPDAPVSKAQYYSVLPGRHWSQEGFRLFKTVENRVHAICPEGFTSGGPYERKLPGARSTTLTFAWPEVQCKACPRRETCVGHLPRRTISLSRTRLESLMQEKK